MISSPLQAWWALDPTRGQLRCANSSTTLRRRCGVSVAQTLQESDWPAMETLRARGARIVVLSNSGRSGAYNASRMAKLGFPPQLYDRFVTSGDVAKSLLLEGKMPIAIRATTRCLTLSSSGSHELADELGLTSVDDAACRRLGPQRGRQCRTPAARVLEGIHGAIQASARHQKGLLP